ncbi:hypothetical protein HWC53_gp030 [Bacillus phage vB_BmeM-Goe8]|uniref:Uncharacterized protein n=1 Tax=Bacillus phage vB_BmeM-Goe8 TaxID=2593638 RepID=A0A516KMI5_9CAUD|nr:hypothetical protein HWC53_gp030 [Bacillus phage vB_BmeM-Goe8]QDP42814.1 hypothetical protein Goe8_c00300 [Bacillus phage vB_BmeM-Goe8]
MSYADDLMDCMFEQMWAMERRDAQIEEELAVGEYLHRSDLTTILGDTRGALQSLPPHKKTDKLPATAQSIFIQGIAGRKLSDKQMYALGLFVYRFGNVFSSRKLY